MVWFLYKMEQNGYINSGTYYISTTSIVARGFNQTKSIIGLQLDLFIYS